ncbi:unnamed protein product [Clonostachys solani]|uniref:WW domain-containing protein n=1 Tax=Clonostachys solani TaxID=160281 RepID=A0A9P0EGS4_9HYPO|nr:unnamed protein product [Clonostachys solani]
MSSPSSPPAAPRKPASPEQSPSKNNGIGDSEKAPGAPNPSEPPRADPSKDSVDETPVAATADAESAPPLPDEDAPDQPPLPNEAVPDGPPLPNEPVPQAEDDGWDCQWDANTSAWFFYNRFTGKSQWDNPRVPDKNATPAASEPQPPTSEAPVAGGYNPAIHGNYDPNAWYAKGYQAEDGDEGLDAAGSNMADPFGSTGSFNRFTGQFQSDEAGPNRHTDEAKSRRQMNAFFDVDAAANSHDGRSLKAERSNKKPSKSELKAFKEKRKARKEEKRRAWLRD